MSSHFIHSLRGASKCVFHAPRPLIKCRGSLVVRPPGIPDYFRICQASCCQKLILHKHPDFAQALRLLQQKQNFYDFSEIARLHAQNAPVYNLFIPQISAYHPMLRVRVAVMSQPSIERNSTMPLPAFLSVIGCLLNSRKF